MITIPNDVFTKYIDYLINTGVPASSHAEYKKWLRYISIFVTNIRFQKQSLNEYVAHALYELSAPDSPTEDSKKSLLALVNGDHIESDESGLINLTDPLLKRWLNTRWTNRHMISGLSIS